MQIKSIKQAKKIKNKTILLRCDFDVPIKNNHVLDDSRLQACLPTIKYIQKKQAKKIILIGHRGRPSGSGFDKNLSLKPIQTYLIKNLKQNIDLLPIDRYLSQNIRHKITQSNNSLVLLENLRFSDREKANCKKFSKNLSSLADIYVNEAFAVSHRKASSVVAIQDYLPSFCGLHLEQEIIHLQTFLKKPPQPLTLIIGGAKIKTKLPLIKKMLPRATHILTGGGVANNLIKAQGFKIGQSIFEADQMPASQQLIKNQKIIIPIDVKTKQETKKVNQVKHTDKILDIGPETTKNYNAIINTSQSLIWNGPLGYFEEKKFAKGTYDIAKTILNAKNLTSVIGGGETSIAINKLKNKNKLPKKCWLSVGGGAMLEYLSGKNLPGFKHIVKSQ